MRDIKITYNHIKNIRARADTIIKELKKREVLDGGIEGEILAAKSLDALDHLVSELFYRSSEHSKKMNANFVNFQYAPFKTASKSSLFERAKALGLEEVALQLIHEPYCSTRFSNFVKKDTEGVDNVEKVKDAIKNILSHIFSKDTDVLEAIQNM